MTSRKFSYSHPFGGKIKKFKQLAVGMRIFIPSTQGDKKISQTIHKSRVREVESFFVSITTGVTADEQIGIFGKTEERVTILTVYLPQDVYIKNEKKIAKFLMDKKKKWRQKALAVEFEGDLYLL